MWSTRPRPAGPGRVAAARQSKSRVERRVVNVGSEPARYVCLRRAGAGCSELRATKLMGRRACTSLVELPPDSQFR